MRAISAIHSGMFTACVLTLGAGSAKYAALLAFAWVFVILATWGAKWDE